jgi:XTP/dITP diphosphohydrolase
VVAVARLASSNAHKARELERALPGWRIELLGAGELPEEDGETYYDNALIKARFGRSVAGADEVVLGEDSGIEAAALGGRPGVHSARWGKPGSSVDRLLRELEGASDRGARYVCELVALLPDGTEVRGRGTLDGSVGTERRGTGGFGYDPIFIPEGEEQTVAELGDEWKAKHSHRARAALRLIRGLPRPAATSGPASS